MGNKGSITRRNFIKGTAAVGVGLGLDGMLFSPTKILAEEKGPQD